MPDPLLMPQGRDRRQLRRFHRRPQAERQTDDRAKDQASHGPVHRHVDGELGEQRDDVPQAEADDDAQDAADIYYKRDDEYSEGDTYLGGFGKQADHPENFTAAIGALATAARRRDSDRGFELVGDATL